MPQIKYIKERNQLSWCPKIKMQKNFTCWAKSPKRPQNYHFFGENDYCGKFFVDSYTVMHPDYGGNNVLWECKEVVYCGLYPFSTEGTIYCVNVNRVQWLNNQIGTNTSLYFNRNARKQGNTNIYFLPSENCCY